MTKILFSLLLSCVCVFTYGQTRNITGTVTATDGSEIPGVSVIVQGTNKGALTKVDGTFSVDAEKGQTLVFSFVGMETQSITIGNQNVINITLEDDDNTLSEVIVVGYGTTTKQSFTGTATQVDSKKIESKNVSNIGQALAGEVAGVNIITGSGQPGSSPTIRIRGFGSVNGNRDPLYVVDGIPYNGNINAINPSDIASTTILKDASATAIYGSRGANGVVVITTKNGRGSNGEDSFIELDTRIGTNKSLIPRYSRLSSPEEYIGLSWEAMYNKGLATGEEDPQAYANENLFSSSGISPHYNMWNVADGGELIDPSTRTVRSGVTRKYDPENWQDYAFQPSSRISTDLKIGGSNKKTSYFTSFGYLKDVGYSINSDYERINTRVSVNHQAKKWLDGSLNLAYTNSKSNNNGQTEDSGSIFWFVDNIPSMYPLFLRDETGAIVPDPIFGGNQYDYGQNGRGFGALTNSISDATNSINQYKMNEISTNAKINIHFTDWLSLENTLGTQLYLRNRDDQNNPFYGPSVSSKGSIYKTKEERFSTTLLNLLRFKKNFGNHDFEAIAAHEATQWSRSFLTAFKFNLVDPFGTELNNAVQNNPPTSYTREYAIESYFGQLNYNFNNKYFLSGTLRRDGSSKFLNNKWGTFGSVGAAWILSKESFMANQNLFNNLKLKASYGIIGEQNTYGGTETDALGISYYPGYDLFEVNPLNDNPSLTFKSKGNPDLTWESSKMFQAGVEFGIGKRFEGAIDYFVKNTDNLVFDRRVGPSIGYAFIKVNDGQLRNQGLEFDLNTHILDSKDYFLDFRVNGALLNNKLNRMPIEPATGLPKVINIDGYYGQSTGHSIFDFYMREWAGVNSETGLGQWNQYYFDENGDGEISDGESIASMADYLADFPDREGSIKSKTTTTYADATQKFVGKSAVPKIRGGFSLNGGAYGFEIGTNFIYSLGGYAYDAAYANLMRNGVIGSNNWHTDIRDRWQNAGDITDVPKISSNQDNIQVNSTSTRFLTKSNFLNLNNVRIGYNIPTKLLSNINITSAKVYFSGDNLWLTSARQGFNPSTDETGESDQYRYSPLSTLTMGLTVKF